MQHRADPGASTQIFLTFILSQRSPLDKLSVIMAVLVFMPFSQQPSYFQVPTFHLLLPWTSSEQAKVGCCDLTQLRLKSMQLLSLSSHSFNIHQGRVLQMGAMFAVVL